MDSAHQQCARLLSTLRKSNAGLPVAKARYIFDEPKGLYF